MLRNIPLAIIATATLGLAPYSPEPHLLGKVRWVLGGAQGMAGADWFDLVMHGAPVLWLLLALMLRLPIFNQKQALAVKAALAKGGLIVDVRSLAEFQSGSAPGAKSVPVDSLPAGIKTLTQGNHDVPLIIFCASGGRAGRAASVLRTAGYRSVENLGGLSRARQIIAAAQGEDA